MAKERKKTTRKKEKHYKEEGKCTAWCCNHKLSHKRTKFEYYLTKFCSNIDME